MGANYKYYKYCGECKYADREHYKTLCYCTILGVPYYPETPACMFWEPSEENKNGR